MRKKVVGRRERFHRVKMNFAVMDKGQKNVLKATQANNCDCRGGVLKGVLKWTRYRWATAKNMTCNIDDVIGIFIVKAYDSLQYSYTERIGVVDLYGNVYVASNDSSLFLCVATKVMFPTWDRVGEGKSIRVAVFGDRQAIMINGDGSLTQFKGLYFPSSGGAYYKHRLFVGVKPHTLAYSEPENIYQFAQSLHDGGTLGIPEMASDIGAIKVFRDSLYLFFPNGIMKLQDFGSPKDFKLKRIPYGGGSIFHKTVCVGNQAIYFMASDGVFRFDGVKAERIYDGFVKTPYQETGAEGVASLGDKIYFRYLEAANKYTTLVIYEDGEDAYYMNDLEGLSLGDSGKIMFKDGGNTIARLDENGGIGIEATFNGAKTDFGVAGRKTLRKIRLKGSGSCYMEVTGERLTRFLEFYFEDGYAEASLVLQGTDFTFNITCPAGSKIENMTAEFTCLD